MTGRNILSDDFVPDVPVVPKGKKGRNILEEPKQSLGDFFKQHLREIMKNAGKEAFGQMGANISEPMRERGEKIGYGMLPAYENLPGGIKEGVQSAAAGLTGQPYEYPAASNEYGAGFGRGAGRMIGQGLIAAPIAGAAGMGIGALGAPALVSGLTGTALGFGATTPGNALERLLAGGEAAAIHGGAKFIGALAGGEIPIQQGIKRVKNILDVPKLREKSNLAAQNLENLEERQALENEALDNEKFNLESNPEIASSNPSLLARKAEEARLAKEGLESEIAPAPEMNASHMPPKPLINPEVSEAENLLRSHEQKLAEAEKALKPLEEVHAENIKDLSKFLGEEEGAHHQKRVATKLNPILEARASEIGKGYNKYIEGLKDKNITLSNPRDAKAITQELNEAIQKGGFESKEVQKLAQELHDISSSKANEVPAGDFVAAYRSLRKMAQKVRSSGYGKDEVEKLRLFDAADKMDADVERMEAIINQGLGKENLKELHHLNHRWATEVTPLYKNRFYQTLLAKSKAPSSMIEELTNEPYIKSTNPNKVTGTQILNDIIKNDPELLHNVIGEKFAGKPENLLNPDELEMQYIAQSPDVMEKVAALRQSKHALETAQAAKAQAKARHEHHKANHAKIAEEAKAQKKANTVEQERRTQVAKKFDEMEALNHSAHKLEEAYKTAERLAKQKKLSLKEKIRLDKEAKKAKAEFEKANKDRNKALVGLGALAIPGSYVGKKLGLY